MFKLIIKKIKNNSFLSLFLKHLVYFYLKIIFSTYRLKVLNGAESKKILDLNQGVFYFWHQNIIAATYFFSKKKLVGHCIISPSKDGEIIGFIAKKLGFKVIYGSAYKETIKLIRTSLEVLELNKKLAIVGDGSRGPAFKLQKGVIYLASKSRIPLIFIDCKSEWTFTFTKSWDNFQIPLPFSKIYVKVHTPTYLSTDTYKNF